MLEGGPHELVVGFLDSNYCLHYPEPSATQWLQLLNAKTVRLVACLGFIDELDLKKDHPTLGSRAKLWLRKVDKVLDGDGVIRPNVTIESFATDAAIHSVDHSKGDAPIVDQAKEFMRLNPEIRVVVISEDRGMRLRCQSQQVDCVRPDEATRLPDPVSDLQKEVNSLKKDLLEEQNRKAALKLMASVDGSETDDIGPLRISLRKKNTDFHSKILPFLEGNNIRPSSHALANNGPYNTALANLKKWCDNQIEIEDESDRTFALTLRLSNKAGRVFLKNAQVTIAYSESQISAEVTRMYGSGSRTPRMPFPRFLPVRHEHFNGQMRIVQPPEIAAAEEFPSGASQVHSIGGGLYNCAVRRANIEWNEREIGHGKETTSETVYLTFRSWDQVKPLVLRVRLYAEETPTDRTYQIPIIPTIE